MSAPTMNPLDMALARLADLPDDELLLVAEQLQEDANLAARRWGKAKAELLKRTRAAGATVIDAGDILCQIDWDKTYEWDIDVVAEEAPQFTGWTRERVIPSERVVTNTRALNEHIKKLGRSAKAERLAKARHIIEKNPKFTFHHVRGEDE